MKRLFFFLSSLLFLNFSASAQAHLSGSVLDGTGQPLADASVLLLDARDSSLVKGALGDGRGRYAFENVRAGRYRLSASRVGYAPVLSEPVEVSEAAPAALPPLTLTERAGELDGATVTAKKPFVEQKLDRTIVNVAGSIIASGSTALEVLEKAPGVTVDRQNDAIQLRGREGVIVLIDGRQTYLSMADVVALLRSTPSDNIDRLELVTNPSARYDAAGNAGLIDIRLKQNNNVGTNGSASLAGGTGRYGRSRGSLQVNHRTARLNLFGSYSANRGGNYWDFDLRRDQADGEARNLVDQLSYIRFWERGQNAKVGLDWFFGKNTTVGVVCTGFWSNLREQSPAYAWFRRQEGGPVYLHTLADKALKNSLSNQVANLNVQHTFGKTGKQLTADLDFGHFSRLFTNALTTRTLLPTVPPQPTTGLFTRMPATIDILTGKVDYSQPLPGGWKLEAGAKSASVFSDNDLTLLQGLAENLQRDDSLSNHFRYTEQVNAAYAMVAGKLGGKTEVQAGLRVEHTHSDAHSLNLGTRVVRDYVNLFPTLFVSRPLNDRHTLTASYGYRIDRPVYQYLNPARSYLDPYAFSRGNPYLRPQYTHALELKHGYRNKVFTSLGANLTDEFIFFIIQPVTGNTTERVPENFGRSDSYNLTVSFPVTLTPRWSAQATFVGTYGQFRFTYLGVSRRVEQVMGRLTASSALTLGRGWSAEATGWLATPAVYAVFRSPWLGTLDLGVQKSFGPQWKVKLSVQDVFHTNQILGWLRTPEFRFEHRIRMDTRVAMLNLSYAFGNQQLKAARQRRTASEDETRRAN